VAVDVGGTKILAAVVRREGRIVARKKTRTPRDAEAKDVVETILDAIESALKKADLKAKHLKGIGLAVPGVIDDEAGTVLVAPNVPLAGMNLVRPLKERFDTDVAMGNDVDLGTLGEAWLGAGRGAHSVVGVFPGTGVGGGLVLNGKLWRGAHGFAGEIGHMIVDHRAVDDDRWLTPGSVESLASRTAIEREIRDAVAAGEKTALHDILDGDLSLIKSGALAKALDREDPLVTRVIRDASHVLAAACLSLRRILDPQVIVIGGGVAEACGDFILPVIDQIMSRDPINPRADSNVKLSELGDDAVLLGAVALAQTAQGFDPLSDTPGHSDTEN